MKLNKKFKNHSLVPKLLLSVMAIVGCIFAIIAFILSATVKDYYYNNRVEKIQEVSGLIKQSVNAYTSSAGTNLQQLNAVLQFGQEFLNADIILTDSQGVVFAVSNKNDNGYKLQKIVHLDGKDILTNDDLDYDNGDFNVYSKKLYNTKKEFEGVIIVKTPLDQMKLALKQIYSIIWFFVILTLIILSIVIYAVSDKFIINPIEQVNEVSRKIAKGKVSERVKIDSNDELGELANNFNNMADAIEKLEQNRREFISNVSHELRSPMTSIKGFIAGILDGIIPPDKEHFYLAKVSDEIERLTRLISDLLDISAMQAGKLTFNFSKVNINEMIRTAVINLEPKVTDKNLSVEINLDSEEPMVNADKDKLMQVATNLTDNAIKYCIEGGNIKISSKCKADKVIISIYNDSPQLTEDQLRMVWDRFYKADKSRTNKYSTGLGLSIVMNIITNHKQEIWCKNSDDANGVVFEFTLDKWDDVKHGQIEED
ncbi:HAMP domain-containing sensor histidine kinase [uncultured Clostridium sp.]|uniref:sensor histidine kinase n=1 Tax=uncultured Clostridium sp. TaxID=59620 RepID=UPI00262D3A6A|nr:HAMP domain-containing sensor histidine kinase [uncultured Clostridium sp.]